MKILEKNNQVKCDCGCVIEYEKSDIHTRERSHIHNQLFFTRDYFKVSYIECPQCSREIELSSIYQGTH